MKKVILSVAVIATVSLTSCFKKDRNCTCTYTEVETTTYTVGGKTTTETETSTYAVVGTFTKARKGDAKKACISYKTTDSEDLNASTHIDTETTADCSVK